MPYFIVYLGYLFSTYLFTRAGNSDRNVSVRLSVCLSVRPFVRHAPILCQNEES